MMIVNTQCQATTTRRLKARTKSMNWSRSGSGSGWGVADGRALVPSTAMARARGWWPISLIVTVLVLVNVASNRLIPKGGYVAWAILSSAVLVLLAVRVDGRSWDELGLARATWARGLRWGAVLAGSVLAIYVVAVAVPATRDLFRDERVEGWTLGQSVWAAFVRVPLGTVLLEEVAFLERSSMS